MLLRTRQKNRGFSSNEFLKFLSDRSERHEVDNEFSKEFRKKPIGTVFFGDVLLVVSVFFDVIGPRHGNHVSSSGLHSGHAFCRFKARRGVHTLKRLQDDARGDDENRMQSPDAFQVFV